MSGGNRRHGRKPLVTRFSGFNIKSLMTWTQKDGLGTHDRDIETVESISSQESLWERKTLWKVR